MLILKATNGRWVEAEKVMAIAFLLEKVYGLTKACFVPGRIPWSRDVEQLIQHICKVVALYSGCLQFVHFILKN